MKKSFFIIVFVLLFLEMVNQSSAVSSSLPMPQIYYYDSFANAVVLEDADGSNSAAIIQYSPVDSPDIVHGPGWSPSGAWLGMQTSNSSRNKELIIIEGNGKQRTLIQSEDGLNMDTTWSPRYDQLLMRLFPMFDAPNTATVYDVANDEEIYLPINSGVVDSVIWSPEGRYLTPTGVLPDDTIQLIEWPELTTQYFKAYSAECTSQAIFWAPDESFLYKRSTSELAIHKPANNQTHVLSLLPNIEAVWWSRDSSQALLYTKENCVADTLQLWHLSRHEQSLTLLADAVIPPALHMSLKITNPSEQLVWNADYTAIIFVTPEGAIHVIQLADGSDTVNFPQFTPGSDAISWSHDPQVLSTYIANDDRSQLINHNVMSGNQTIIFETEGFTRRYFSWSSSGTYIAFTDWTGEHTLHILNVDDRSSVNYSLIGNPYEGLYDVDPVYEVLWHPRNDRWLFLMGPKNMYLTNVARADISYQRQLSEPSPNYYGWVTE